jgi:hypothetical protein
VFKISTYYSGHPPAIISEEAMKLIDKFEKESKIHLDSVDELVYLLFEDLDFVSYAALGTQHELDDGMAFVAFNIMLDEFSEGVLKTDKNGSIFVKDAALQLIFNEQNPNSISDYEYTLAYPETNISSQNDIIILYDSEKAKSVFDAWAAGVPFIDDCETVTFTHDKETGEWKEQSQFRDELA